MYEIFKVVYKLLFDNRNDTFLYFYFVYLLKRKILLKTYLLSYKISEKILQINFSCQTILNVCIDRLWAQSFTSLRVDLIQEILLFDWDTPAIKEICK